MQEAIIDAAKKMKEAAGEEAKDIDAYIVMGWYGITCVISGLTGLRV